MGHTRVIYTDSTTAECGTVLGKFDFNEDTQSGCWVLTDEESVKAYLVWGRTQYYPPLHQRLGFTPRVQIHFKTKDKVNRIDYYARETAMALKILDPGCNIQTFDADSGAELSPSAQT